MPASSKRDEQLVGPIDLEPRSVALLHRVGGRVALVGRADDRATEVGDARGTRSRLRSIKPSPCVVARGTAAR